MIAPTSNNSETCNKHTKEYHDSHHPILLLPPEEKLKEQRKFTEDENDSENDDFGDFETAARTATDENEGINSPFDMQIERLLEEGTQMNSSDCETAFDRILLHCQPAANNSPVNLFSVLGIDRECNDKKELDQIEELPLKSLNLWQQISYFEEIEILNFQWANSRGSEMLLKALSHGPDHGCLRRWPLI